MLRILGLSMAALLSACGGGGSEPLPAVDGTWQATGQPVGSALAMVLKEQNSNIVGVGTYRVEAGASGALVVAGTRSGAVVTLELAYDNGTKATYAALLTDATHMTGALSGPAAAGPVLSFVKQ